VGFDGDDGAVSLPDVLKQSCDELATLGRVALCFPELREVFKERLRPVDVGCGGGLGALEFFLQRLAGA
jgi:hypothetical protein